MSCNFKILYKSLSSYFNKKYLDNSIQKISQGDKF